MRLIESLNWRYATKTFNANKKMAAEDLAVLKEAVRLAATSYGLQPFKVKVIDDAMVKEKLKVASYGQSQIADCSHVFVFTHLTELLPEFVDNYIELCAHERDIELTKLEGYGTFMKKTLGALDEKEMHHWATKQAYIGMSNLLTACADLRIDACPIEGFDTGSYNAILGLNDLSLSACVVVAVGYRDENDETQHLKKVRLATEDLFF